MNIPIPHAQDANTMTNAVIASNFSVQPDLQYVINPGGATSVDNALVGTIRLKLAF